MLKAPARKVVIGPEDHGRSMSLDEFDRAVGTEGYLYELNKGVIEVTNIPNLEHGLILAAVRRQMEVYADANEGVIYFIAPGNDAKVMLASLESERHADLSVYLRAPRGEGREIWSKWVPEVVVEVVSKGSIKRDYEDKPPEYLAFGVEEYWIVDGLKKEMTALSRWRGQWKTKVFKPTQKYTTSLLPEFSLDLKRVFASVR